MIENDIKVLIKYQYGTTADFCKAIDIPYSTLDSILKRGILKSNFGNVVKICKALNMSLDVIAEEVM